VSLAPLADSAASQSLGDSAHQSRAGARPGRLAERATATRADSARRGGTEHRRIGPPARKRAAPAGSDSAVHGYAPATDSTAALPADTAAATQHHVAAMPTPDSAVERAPSDTSAVGRAAVGDSIIPAATPVVPAPDSAPREPRDSPASPDQTDSSPSATPVPVGATASPDASGSPRAADSGGATDSAAATESPGATQSPGTTESASRAHVARNALPVGTQIRAILDDSITSLRNSVGQRVSAVVSGDLRAADGLAVLPSGSVVHLTIDRLAPARTRSAKDGELVLRADSIVAGGHAYPIDAALQAIPHELRGRGVTAGEVEKVGAGAAAGAVVGGVVTGKTKGAVVGGAVGAVGGAVVAAQTASRDVVVAPRTLITLVLRSPVVRVVP
jgi:hypothetical protein